jgi:circadian clock protein KaiC
MPGSSPGGRIPRSSIFTAELDLFRPELELRIESVSATVENILVLRYVEYGGRLHRLLSVMKMRESAYDSSLRELTIGVGGIGVARKFESAEQLLTGSARDVGSRPRRRGRGGDPT